MKKIITAIIIGVIVLAGIGTFLFFTSRPAEPASNSQSTATSVVLTENITDHPLSGTVNLSPIIKNSTTIEKVELLVDNTVVHVSYAEPYKLALDTTTFKNGSHTLLIKVTQADHSTIISETFAIKVENSVTQTESPAVSEGNTNSTQTVPTKSVTTNPPVSSGGTIPSSPATPATPVGDTEAPSSVAGITVVATNDKDAHVTWSAATDNTDVTSYAVLRSGVVIATVTSQDQSYDDTDIVPGNYYTYAVIAYDAAGNASAPSARSAITLPLATALHGSPLPSEDAGAEQALSVGMKFTPKVDGELTGVRFYKFAGNTGEHIGALWDAGGNGLAIAFFANETVSGWQMANFLTPVKVTAGMTYTVSYHMENGYYAATAHGLAGVPPADPYIEPLQSTSGAPNGVFKYTPYNEFPSSGFNDANYWVDPMFRPYDTTTNATTDSLARVPWEGGPSYYQQFAATNNVWTNSNFFPIGVWFESVLDQANVTTDKVHGINTYVQLTGNSDLSIVRNNGSYAIAGNGSNIGAETVGYYNADEADMNFGPGYGAYDEANYRCVNSNESCGYTAMALFTGNHAPNSHVQYANYGKGVMMWETQAEAAKFVNDYTDVVSNDMYFYTDPGLCGEALLFLGIPTDKCRLSANYGYVLDKMRALDALDSKRQPIWAFVEDGHPFTENTAPTITPDQLAGAVYSSLIHEARGIIYFNHNFGGSCISQHVIRDNCFPATSAKIAQVNQQVTALAPVLNSQSYVYDANPKLDTMLKGYDGSYYLFAMTSRDTATGTYALRLPADLHRSSVQVVNESRSLPVVNGIFTDTFANEYTYHVYKITP